MFRAVHSIKGGAGAFSLEALVRFAHVFETALDEMRSGRLAPTADVLKTMLRAADVLADLVRAARDGAAVDEAHTAALADELQGAGSQRRGAGDEAGGEEDWGDFDFKPLSAAAPTAPAAGGWRVRFKPRADLYAKANEAALLLRELARLGETEVDDAAHARRRAVLARFPLHSAALDHAFVCRGTEHGHSRNAHDGSVARLAGGGRQVFGVPGILCRAMGSDRDLSARSARP